MIVELENLSFSYGERPVLDNVSFSALPGEITAIVGANGAGKTTMLRCIAGLFRHEGIVTFDSEVRSWDDMSDFLSYMEQNTDCDAELNVFEIVLLGMTNALGFRVSESDIEKVNRVMELVGVDKYAGRKIGELSGGQRQLVFIAQALVKEPKVLILDEPTSALDLYRQYKLIEFVKKVTGEKGCVTIMTLHHLDMALKFADKVAVMDGGKLYSFGSPDEVFNEKMVADVYRMRSRFETDEAGQRHLLVMGPTDE